MISGPYYINLDHREDRKSQVVNEFQRMGFTNFIRVPAIYDQDGAAGCIKSHISTMRNDKVKTKATWICEDDIEFRVDRRTLDEHVLEFMDSDADILCLGNASRKHENFSERLMRSYDLQTTSCYIVKAQFKPVLESFWESVLVSKKTNNIHPLLDEYNSLSVNKGDFFAADQSWKILQQYYKFVIPKTRCVIQKSGYSDIERRVVDYGI